MTQHEATELLQSHRNELTQLGVDSLALFGSVAKGKAGPDSDVDMLVTFSKPVGFFEFLDAKNYLEHLLGRPVDLVTEDALKPQLRESILAEAVRVG
jgi:uncharacterized protein